MKRNSEDMMNGGGVTRFFFVFLCVSRHGGVDKRWRVTRFFFFLCVKRNLEAEVGGGGRTDLYNYCRK